MKDPTVVAAANSRPSVVDWAAILAGAVLAAGVGIVLNAFGAALGLGTLSVGDAESSFNLWLVVSGFWMVVTLVLTYMAGGYVAGRMRRRGDGISDQETSVRDGVHGLVVWALGMIAMAWMAASLLGAATTTVASVAGTTAEVAGEVAGTTLAAGVEAAGGTAGEADTALVRSISDRLSRPDPASLSVADTGADPAQLIRQSASILADVARTGEISDEDRLFLTAATIRVSGVPPDLAEARTEAAISAAQELRAKAESLAASAKSDAIAAAEAARKGAIVTAFVLAAASLVAAAAAVAGGVYGGAHRDENRFFSGFTFHR